MQNHAQHNTNVTERDLTWFLHFSWLQEFIQQQT